MKTVAIIQARMGSTRLPGKVLKSLAGRPMLERCVNRVCRARLIDEVLVATTRRAEDDVIEALCLDRQWACYRGSTEDLLDRYYRAAQQRNAQIIVRITSDCPLIDPGIIDEVTEQLKEEYDSLDFVANCMDRYTFPRGLDVEAMKFSALERAWQEDANLQWREHVTPFIYLNKDKFRCRNVEHETDLSYMRLTVDTEEDFQLVRKIFDHFGHDGFSWREVVELLDRNPSWLLINRHVRQKQLQGV